jgi:hypothetical protein
MSEPSWKTKSLVDARDQYSCVVCGRRITGDWPGASRHHRLPRSHKFPGLHLPSNLILVCGSGDTGCHGRIHANPAWAYERGFLLHSWQDPLKTPLRHCKYGELLIDDEGFWTVFDEKELEEAE